MLVIYHPYILWKDKNPSNFIEFATTNGSQQTTLRLHAWDLRQTPPIRARAKSELATEGFSGHRLVVFGGNNAQQKKTPRFVRIYGVCQEMFTKKILEIIHRIITWATKTSSIPSHYSG